MDQYTEEYSYINIFKIRKLFNKYIIYFNYNMADVLTPVVTEESEEKPQEKVNKKK